MSERELERGGVLDGEEEAEGREGRRRRRRREGGTRAGEDVGASRAGCRLCACFLGFGEDGPDLW